jgi:hypothetical protein
MFYTEGVFLRQGFRNFAAKVDSRISNFKDSKFQIVQSEIWNLKFLKFEIFKI